MKSIKLVALLFSLLVVVLACDAQCTNNAITCFGGVPRFVKLSGALKKTVGLTPTGVAAIKFVVYGDSTGGTPLWQEVQNVKLDEQGHYEVMLGANTTDGIPINLFISGEPRWLGVQALAPGSEEEPRILMVSVPYALEAADAQTLGGLPVSAFFLKAGSVASAEITSSASLPLAGVPVIPGAGSVPPGGVTASGATPGTIPKFASGTAVVDSQITDQAGVVSMENLSNVLFADRFTGGVPDAVNACPASGCVIYAYSPKVNLNLGTIDPGTKAITIYLGPYVYMVKQITLRTSMKIIGMGASTTLQSTNGNNPVFVIPQVGIPVTSVVLSGFQLLGSAGNTSEDGFFIDASSSTGAGLWFSTFSGIGIAGFAGVGMHLKARSNDFASSNQWLLFNNLSVQRTPGGGNALRLEGSVFELRFRNCEFDGQAIGDGTNIYIGGFAGGISGYPLSIVFEGLVSQRAATAVQIDGAVHLTFNDSHHEELWGGYQITNNTNIGTMGLTIADSYFAANVGTNSGAGYILNVATESAHGIVFAHNQIMGTPDSVVRSTNFASVVYKDNLSYFPTSKVPPTSGLSTQISPATTINVQGVHTVGLNSSSTPITTIVSSLGPGEFITFFPLGGSVTFGTGPGGNIDLMGMSSLTVNGTITFVRTDLGGLYWRPVSQWSPTPERPATAASLSK